jgi:hypothetical protein
MLDVAGGDTLPATYSLEKRQQIDLPVLTFDGIPASVAVRQPE